MPNVHDHRNLPLTPGAPKTIGKNTRPTIQEFEDARCGSEFPDEIHVSDIKAVLTTLGAHPEALGERKEFYYLVAKQKVLPAIPHPIEIKAPEDMLEEDKPLYAGQPKKPRPPKEKRHLILVKEVPNAQ